MIEWNLPLTQISQASTHEKSVRHGHPSTLHLWWARRPLASSRATTFATLMDLPATKKKRQELLNFLEKIVPWNTIKSNLSPVIHQAQEQIRNKWIKNPPKVLDPFSGGGSIPLEALRLGCETYASDLNPVAVIINKATLEWPQQIANPLLAQLVNKWAIIISNLVEEEIGKFYPHDSNGNIPIGYLWHREIKCPNPLCTADIPLIKHFWLARTKKRLIAYKPIVNKSTKTITYQIQENQEIDFNPSRGTISKAKARCLVCNLVVDSQKIRDNAKKDRLRQKMSVVILRNPIKKNKIYRVATRQDTEIFNQAKKYLYDKFSDNEDMESLLPDEELPPIGTLGFSVQNYSIIKWKDLFNFRQQLSLVTFLECIKSKYPEISQEVNNLFPNKLSIIPNLADIVLVYLSIIFGRLADKNANIVIYNVYGEKIEHVFGRTALPMVWDYVELNVFSGANGDWLHQAAWVVRFLENNTWKAPSSVSISQASATDLNFPDSFFDAIITDPPYYDNVPYSDLSDFFYVWFKRLLGNRFPNLFATPLTPKSKEIVANKGRQKNPREFFEINLSLAFNELYRVLKPDGILLVVYAHRSSAGWETMLQSLVRSGFVITASWPIHTEMRTRLRARTSAALASSIYLVCRKHPQREIGYFREIQGKVEAQIQRELRRFWKNGIRGGDFFISAIGPAMKILSQYRRIERYSGKEISFKEQLDFVRSITTSFLVNNLLENQEIVSIDKISQFYLAYRWAFQDSSVDFVEAQKLSQACGVEIESGINSGLILKQGSKITVLDAYNRRTIENNNLEFVNLMHKAILAWKESDEEKLKLILSPSNSYIDSTFWLFCQAVSECLPKDNPEKKSLEGLLVSKYSI